MKEKSKYYLDSSMDLRKSIIMYKIDGCVHSPVMYLKKPKWVSDEDFKDLFNRMQIMIKE